MPRAATSVATQTCARPSRRACSAPLRSAWLSSPDKATAAKPRLGPIAQAAAYAGAVLAALAALGTSLLLGVGPTPTLLAVPMLVAALAVIAPVMLGALLSGRRPGTLGPASGILVGATALQVAVLVALG